MRLVLRSVLLILFLFTGIALFAETRKNPPAIDSLLNNLRHAGTDSAKAMILNELAKTVSLSDYKPAMEYADRAVEMAEKSGSRKVLQLSFERAGDIYMKGGLFDVAARYYTRNLQLVRSIGKKEDLLTAYIGMGAIYLSAREYEKAMLWFTDAGKLAEEMKREHGDTIFPLPMVSVFNNLSIIEREKGRYVKALEYNDFSIDLCRKYAKRRTLARLLSVRGDVLIGMKQYNLALQALTESFELTRTIGDSIQMALTLNNLGRTFKEQGNYREAIPVFTKALHAATKTNDLMTIANASSSLYEIYKKTGPADSALMYLTRYQEDEKRVKTAEASKELLRQELMAQFKAREEEEQTVQHHKELLSRILIAVAVIILLLFVFYLIKIRSGYKKVSLEKVNLELHARKTELDRQLLQAKVDAQDKQLALKVMKEMKNNEIITEAVEKLMIAREKPAREQPHEIRKVIHHLEKSREDKVWDEFDLRFEQINSDFYQKLREIDPGLTPNERRLCAFIRQDMTTKEISAITGQTANSIDVARTRMRKKLNLTNTQQPLSEFLAAL